MESKTICAERGGTPRYLMLQGDSSKNNPLNSEDVYETYKTENS